MKGHFIHDYGDSQKPDAQIKLLPSAIAYTDALLGGHENCRSYLQWAAKLIEGFETPDGMELLSTVLGAVSYPSRRHGKTVP